MAFTEVPRDVKLNPDIKIIKKLWPFLWSKQKVGIKERLLISLGLLLLAKIATLSVPFFFKECVDSLSSQVRIELTIPFFVIIAYGVARLLASLFSETRDVIFSTVTQNAIRSVGLSVFEHLHSLSLRYHLDRQTGGLSRAIERGTKGIENLLQFLIFNIIPTIVEIILVCGVLWHFYGYHFAIITFITMVGYIAFTLVATEWRMQYVRTMNASDNDANTRAIDSLLNYETVKYFNNERHEATRYNMALERYQSSAIKNRLSLATLNVGQVLIISLGLISIMVCAGFYVKNHALTVGSFVAINTYLIQLYTPLFTLGFAYREIKLSLVNIDQMFALLDAPCEVQDKTEAPQINFKAGEIRFENVNFFYNPNRQILKNLSFTIPAGKTVAVVGSSGAGKSTISRLLFRFYDVTSGKILIDGQDIRDVTQESLRRLIGVVPQDTVLFNDTIQYNIAYGNPSASLDKIIEASKSAQIHRFVETLPDGYNTQVGERGLKLSGGEKQRVAIARTLLKNPKIFLFDEATSALDTRTEKKIQASLKQISQNYTTLIIAHRLSTIIDADQILVLDNGEIVERGTHQELLGNKGLYEAMWQRQNQQEKLPE